MPLSTSGSDAASAPQAQLLSAVAAWDAAMVQLAFMTPCITLRYPNGAVPAVAMQSKLQAEESLAEASAAVHSLLAALPRTTPGELNAAAAEEEEAASASPATMAAMEDAGRFAVHMVRLLMREHNLQVEAAPLCVGANGDQLLEALEGTPDMDAMFQEDWE